MFVGSPKIFANISAGQSDEIIHNAIVEIFTAEVRVDCEQSVNKNKLRKKETYPKTTTRPTRVILPLAVLW